jgi:hypothetical protein
MSSLRLAGMRSISYFPEGIGEDRLPPQNVSLVRRDCAFSALYAISHQGFFALRDKRILPRRVPQTASRSAKRCTVQIDELQADLDLWLRKYNWGYKILAKIWRKESIEEVQHADKTIECIVFLDSAPNMQTLEALHIGQNRGARVPSLEFDNASNQEGQRPHTGGSHDVAYHSRKAQAGNVGRL